ncbi:SAV_6107 family HEPN domain-containing protein [Actinomadura hibisca]|uniref:SAV_6107 family HEPN domain-containing protein n=1 Tax=Actinomadura hibisca TaxID=68565 RepID=UPI000A9B6192|nr:SAV_6107 family HEPN domain-containing protein [Actinomadura hibisca]
MSGTTTRGAPSAVHSAPGAVSGSRAAYGSSGTGDMPSPRPRPHPAPRPAHSVVGYLNSARMGLAEAAEATTPAVRYVCAHLAALRAAAAVLVAKDPAESHRRGRPTSAWVLLPEAEPTLSEWAAFFAAGADKRAAAEAGLPRAVTPQEADELLHDADVFVTLVEDTLGVPGQATLFDRLLGPLSSPGGPENDRKAG